MERCFSFVLKTTSLGGVMLMGLIAGYLMFDVRRVVELSDVMVALVLTRSLH